MADKTLDLIRKYLLMGNEKKISEIIPTPKEMVVLRYIQENELVTTHDLMAATGATQGNMIPRIKSLIKKGYIEKHGGVWNTKANKGEKTYRIRRALL